MADATRSTYEYLLEHYGPLLTLKHVAEVMHTTPASLRQTLSRESQTMAAGLAGARRRLGRRVYFEARKVAEVIEARDGGGVADDGGESPPPSRQRLRWRGFSDA